jgi:hypothetical protein
MMYLEASERESNLDYLLNDQSLMEEQEKMLKNSKCLHEESKETNQKQEEAKIEQKKSVENELKDRAYDFECRLCRQRMQLNSSCGAPNEYYDPSPVETTFDK